MIKSLEEIMKDKAFSNKRLSKEEELRLLVTGLMKYLTNLLTCGKTDRRDTVNALRIIMRIAIISGVDIEKIEEETMI